MTTIEDGLDAIRSLAPAQHWLAVLVTTRPDGEPGVSVVNAGILPHPQTGNPVVALVSQGNTAKLRNLRATPRATLVFRSGWRWVGVSGPTELAGPDDHGLDLDAEGLRLLLRDIYTAAGGQHPDFDEYDRAMLAERRTAVLITPPASTPTPDPNPHERPNPAGLRQPHPLLPRSTRRCPPASSHPLLRTQPSPVAQPRSRGRSAPGPHPAVRSAAR